LTGEDTFEQIITTVCPYCLKEVTIKGMKLGPIGALQWYEVPRHNKECPLDFVVQRHRPERFPEVISVGYPLIFIVLQSKASIFEGIKSFKSMFLKAQSEEEKKAYSNAIDSLQKILTLDLDEVLKKALEAVDKGFFGLRLQLGYGTFAYIWKWGKRYFGFAYYTDDDYILGERFLASDNFSETSSFAFNLFHYYDNLLKKPNKEYKSF